MGYDDMAGYAKHKDSRTDTGDTGNWKQASLGPIKN
jgi:hypothetical protein